MSAGLTSTQRLWNSYPTPGNWQPWVQRAGRNPQDLSKPRTNPQRRPQRGQQTSSSQNKRGLPEWLMGTSLVVQSLRICLTTQGTLGNPWSRKIPQAAEQLSLGPYLPSLRAGDRVSH